MSDVDVEKIGRDSDIGEDAHVVDWDGEGDPMNPLNWPTWKKTCYVGIVSLMTFLTALTSSMFVPGIPQLMRGFENRNAELGSFVVSVYVLGFACGPLLLAPGSELFGRSIIYNTSSICFCLCTIGCAESKSIAMLSTFRFIAGCFGSAPLAIGGGTIADMIPLEKRGAAVAVFTLGLLLGPTIGPVAGGYLTDAKGWRWVFWLLAIVGGAIAIIVIAFLPETHAPTLLEAKAKKLRKSTGNAKLKSKLASDLPRKEVLQTGLIRPLKMLFLSPIIFLISAFMAISYGYLYLLFTAIPTVFQPEYGFSASSVGLSYLGLGVGSLIGLGIYGFLSDRMVVSLTKKHGVCKPEYRLVTMAYGAPLMPIGLLWYGWSAEKHTHWIVPILGTSVFGTGMIASFMPAITYLVDAFTAYAASALAAATVFRSVLGAVLPVGGESMYQALGPGWANSLLALIAVALLPIPVVFERYGERLRKRFDVKF